MKKRILFGIPAFLISFLLGYLVVPKLVTHSEESQIRDTSPVTIAAANSVPTDADAETVDQLETIDEVNDMFDVLPSYAIKLLETGEDGYEYADVPAKNGETWLGLFEENGKYFVRSTNLKISKDANDMVAVNVPRANKPIFLIKNAPMIRSGSVTSVFRGIDNALAAELDKRGVTLDQQSTRLDKNFNQTIKLGSETYVLKVGEARNKKGEKVWALFLCYGNVRQVLQSVNQDYVSEMGSLCWIGDLDHDGRPDFYLELHDGDEAVETALFLSSEAEKDKLVREVAQYWFPGC